jgi:hypothetical protein
MIKPLIELDLAAPALHASGDLLISSPIVIDRPFEKQFRLILRAHLIQEFNFMLG